MSNKIQVSLKVAISLIIFNLSGLLAQNYCPPSFISGLPLDQSIALSWAEPDSLGGYGEEIVLPIIEIFYSKNDTKTRISCLKVLVKVASNIDSKKFPSEIIGVINMALEDYQPEIILTVISLLRQLGSFGINFLKDCCRDENLLKAKAAVSALNELNDPSLNLFFRDLLDDDSIDQFIRQAASECLIV